MGDLTICYYTSNVVPQAFGQRVREQLLMSAYNYPIISISQRPLDFGENICVGAIGHSHLNIYKQMLIGAKAAKTKYIAMAEDDTLYAPEHFVYRPEDDEFAFDMCRWSMYTWSEPPIFSHKHRRVNSMLICPTALFVEAMEERFARDPDGHRIQYWAEPSRYEKGLGVTVRKGVEYWAKKPSIVFTRPEAVGFRRLGERKRLGELRAYSIPDWGTAVEVMEKYVTV